MAAYTDPLETYGTTDDWKYLLQIVESGGTIPEQAVAQQALAAGSAASAMRATLYNGMMAAALNLGAKADLSDEKVRLYIVKSVLLEMVLGARHLDMGSIATVGGTVTPASCCPPELYDLLAPFEEMRTKILTLSHLDDAAVQSYCLGEWPLDSLTAVQQANVQAAQGYLGKLAEVVVDKPRFKMELQKVAAFLAEACGETKALHKPSASQLEGVTAELVYMTFYNVMAEVAFDPSLFSPESLADQDPHIYHGLPAVTLLEVMLRSQTLDGAVWLAEDKALTEANCPAEYGAFAAALLPLKAVVAGLTAKEQQLLKEACVGDERKLDANAKINGMKSKIHDVATQVAQLPTFKAMVPKIMSLFSE